MSVKKGRHRVGDHFLPTVLDRLTSHPETNGAAGGAQMTRGAYHETVLRDLSWLLNCSSIESQIDLTAYPRIRNSVVNFGVPPLAGRRFSEMDLNGIAEGIRNAILTFEPRVLAESLQVTAIRDATAESHNQIVFQIRAAFWFEPYPLEMAIRAQWDVENGIMDLSGMPA